MKSPAHAGAAREVPVGRPPGRTDDGLRRAVLSGLAWKSASQLVVQAMRLGLAITLARLLTPHQFGVAGMVLVFSTFLIPFADLGLGAALVQRSTITREDICTVFWTSLGAGGTFAVLGVGISDLVARFYHQPAVRPLFAALSLSFLITAGSATHRSLLMRDLRFKSLELRLFAGTLMGAPIAIAVAALGFGPWAFIAFELTAATTSTLLVWILLPWRPSLVYSRASLRDLGRFGANTLAARFFSDLSQISDKLLIGRFLGATPLGVYALAYNLVLSPFSRVVAPIQEVLFPAFSRIQNERERVAALWLRSTRLLLALVLPAMVGLVIVAPEFVQVVLGGRWASAVPVVRVLAGVGLLQAVQGVNPSTLLARNKTRELMRFSALSFLASLVAYAIGLHWGILGVATSYVAVSAIFTPYITRITMANLGIGLASLLAYLRGVIEATVGMAGVVLVVRYVLLRLGTGDVAVLTFSVLAGIAAYVPLTLLRASTLIDDARTLLRRRRGESPTGHAVAPVVVTESAD